MKTNIKEIWKCLDEPSDEQDKLDCLIRKLEDFEKELREKLRTNDQYYGSYRAGRERLLEEILGE